MLSMVCNDVEIEPVVQELTGESLPSGADRAPDARLNSSMPEVFGKDKVQCLRCTGMLPQR